MAALLTPLFPPVDDLPVAIRASLAQTADDCFAQARALIAEGLDRLPLPGGGATLTRWRCLEQIGRVDLSLAKVFESHVDALAILREVDGRRAAPRGLMAVWAAEAPSAPLRCSAHPSKSGTSVVLDGQKAWCSGAAQIDVALVTAIDDAGHRWLVEVDLHQDGVTIVGDRWHARGMQDTLTADILFDGVTARTVGASGAYLSRPGFWQGGAGVAACWYGAAAEIGDRVRRLQAGRKDVHAKAHLGRIDCLLAGNAALLRDGARAIDEAPKAHAQLLALRARAATAQCCEAVLAEAMHALGPGPFCNDAVLARHAADLPIFIRQMRAEHDLMMEAELLLEVDPEAESPWSL